MSTVMYTTTNYDPPHVKCETCGHDSSRNNFFLDCTKNQSYEVCSYCRGPLKVKP